MQNAESRFNAVAFLEGVSYIVLMGFAMPMKYIWGDPQYVKWTGWAHGVLFVLYFVSLAECALRARWRGPDLFWGSVASLVPFGTFVFVAWRTKRKR